jgi:hypothetical protein
MAHKIIVNPREDEDDFLAFLFDDKVRGTHCGWGSGATPGEALLDLITQYGSVIDLRVEVRTVEQMRAAHNQTRLTA